METKFLLFCEKRIDSVLDLINMNKNLGYVEVK